MILRSSGSAIWLRVFVIASGARQSVRAKLVADPKDYQWSGYGETVEGTALARKGRTPHLRLPIAGWWWVRDSGIEQNEK